MGLTGLISFGAPFKFQKPGDVFPRTHCTSPFLFIYDKLSDSKGASRKEK